VARNVERRGDRDAGGASGVLRRGSIRLRELGRNRRQGNVGVHQGVELGIRKVRVEVIAAEDSLEERNTERKKKVGPTGEHEQRKDARRKVDQ